MLNKNIPIAALHKEATGFAATKQKLNIKNRDGIRGMISGRGNRSARTRTYLTSTRIHHKSRKNFPGMNLVLREEKPVTNLNDTMAHLQSDLKDGHIRPATHCLGISRLRWKR
jgi:hypothetical protein